MTINKTILLAVAALAAVPSLASDDRSGIQAAYGKLRKAFLTKSVATMDSVATPDFTDTERGHTYNLKQTNEQMKQNFSIMTVKQCDFKIKSLKVAGSKANVLVAFTMHVSLVSPQDGKTHSLVISGTDSDVLVRAARGWLFISSKDVSQSATVDGKPVPAGGM